MAEGDSGFIDNTRNQIGTSIRNLFGSANATEKNDNILGDLGRLIQPEKITRDSNEYLTNTRLANKKTPEELQYYLGENLVPSNNPDDRHFYIIENVNTGEKKFGTSAKDVASRNAGDPSFTSNWKTLYDQPLTNAEEVENTLHGNMGMQDTRKFKNASPVSMLRSGNTEIYKPNNPIFGMSNNDAKSFLNVEQLEVAEAFEKRMAEIKKKQGSNFVGNLDYKPRNKVITNEEHLIRDENFSKKSKQVLEALGKDTTGMSWKDMSEEAVRMASWYNWNLMETGRKAVQVADMKPEDAKAFQEVIDNYDKTDLNMNQIGRGIRALAFDPTTYIGLATFGLGTALSQGGKQAMKTGMKQGIKDLSVSTAREAVKKGNRQLLAKQAGMGALEGGVYTAIDNAIRQSVKEDAGQQTGFDFGEFAKATGIGLGAGTLLAGTIQGIVNHVSLKGATNRLEQSVAKKMNNFEKATPEEKTQMINTLEPEEQSFLADFVKRQQQTGVIPTAKAIKISEKEHIPDINILAKEEVKPEREEIQTTSGRTVKAEEVLESNKTVSNIEYDVKDPRATRGEPIEGQEYIPEINNPKKFSYGYDDRGRVYAKESSALGPQGGPTQKATLEQRIKPTIDNALEEVNRRMDFYDNDADLRKRYGQAQAIYKNTDELSEAQAKANRLQFEKQQYKDLVNSEIGAIKAEAKKELNRLKRIKVKDYKPTPAQEAKAKELFDKQTKVTDTNLKLREIDLKAEYKAYNEAMKESSAKDFEYDVPTKSKEEIKKKVIANAIEDKPKAIEAIREIQKKERLAGREFDPSNINDVHRKKYRNEIGTIEDVQGARADLKLLNEGKIDLKEFIYRAKRRLEEQIKRRDKPKLTTIEEVKEYQESLRREFDEIGVTAKDSKLEFTTPPKGKETPENKAQREIEEVTTAKSKHNKTMKNLEKYEDTRENFIVMKGPRKGQWALSKSQMEDIDREILSLKEIAEKTAPLGSKSTPPTRENLKDLKVEAKEKANLKTTQETRKQLGIKDNLKSEQIQFKDTLLDASNSVAQITTVLLSSKRLAKLSKLYGGKEDIREIVAFKMKDLLPENFPINPEKATVKPLFMTENYGQGEKGLIRNIQKANKVSKEEATQFFKAYEQAFGEIAPEMKMLRDVVYSTMAKNPKGEFSWTLPDGFKVEFQLKKKLDGSFNIKGNEHAFKIDTDNLDDFSKALMPNLIHSVDAYVARRMNKLGIATVHDAFQTPASKTDKYVQEEYGKIMSEINESNLLDNMLRELGYDGPSVNKGRLESSKIKESATKSAIEPEEVKGAIESEKDYIKRQREIDVSKSNTPDEVMKEYMAGANVRDSGFNQLVAHMTNEAGYRTMSVAREGDDVFTHQVAMAHQSEKYNPSKAIKAPDGVDKETWDRVQEQIFNEARARLEYNPNKDLQKAIKGNRKYFRKDGKPVGSRDKTYNEILKTIQEQERREVRAFLKRPAQEQNIVKSISPNQDYTQLARTVKSWEAKKKINPIELQARQIVDEISNEAFEIETNSFKTMWNEQIQNTPVYNEFNKVETIKNVFKAETDRSAEMTHELISKIPKAKQEKINVLVKSDYEAIRGMTKELADEIWNKATDILKIAGKEINATAKALSSESNQYGYALNNAHLIAKRYNLDKNAEETIDKLISIKAMNDNDGWKVLDELGKDKDMDKVLDILAKNRIVSEGLFENNPEKMIKGYRTSVYRGQKELDDTGKVRWNVSDSYEQGVFGSDLQNKRIGKEVDSDGFPEFKSMQEELDFMEKNRLRKTNGVYRKVADEKVRKELGYTDDLAETLSETVRATSMKLKQEGLVMAMLMKMDKGDSKLFSKETKEGFIPLTKEQLSRLPFHLRTEAKFINPEFLDKLVGRKEVRLINSHRRSLQMLDRLLSNFGSEFKRNVVLKNPTSYLNSMLVNQTLGMTIGANPAKHAYYQKEAMSALKEMDDLLKRRHELEITGKPRNADIEERLSKNELYKMERAGLSTNRVEGVLGEDDLMSEMLKAGINPLIFHTFRHLNLNQKTPVGRFALQKYSDIDTMGRYSIVKSLMDGDKSLSLQDAVKQSNGLFGNMDKMAPAIIEKLDKYGLAPFLKWFVNTSPQLLKISVDNPIKSLVIAVGLYELARETETNLSSVNPLEAMIDFAFQTLPLETVGKLQEQGLIDTISNRAESNVIPKYITNARKDPITMGLAKLMKPEVKYEPYQGFVQSTVEKALRNKGE